MKHFTKTIVCMFCLFAFSTLLCAEDKLDSQKASSNNTTTQDKVSKKNVNKKKVNKGKEVKELSGISIIGNKEAPKSLYIVPWKNSEVGVRSSLTSGLLDESMKPIDKEVFVRELDFYELSH